MNIITHYKSKNFSSRSSKNIDSLVFHSTELPFEESLKMLLGYNLEREVSSHFLIDLDGVVYQLVNPLCKAWHAGESFWRGRAKINEYSIGFELVNVDLNGNKKHFSFQQMNSLILLCQKLIKEFPINQKNIVGHSDIAPSRKSDPGKNFNWSLMARNNIGIYYDSKNIITTDQEGSNATLSDIPVRKIKNWLTTIGYKITDNDYFDNELEEVIIAFKRRFYQKEINSIINKEILAIMNNLAIKFSTPDN